MHLFLLRHGRSRADDEQRHEGRYDSPLTPVGKRQVHERAEKWRTQGLSFDRIITSPLKRALETANIMGGTLNSEVEVIEDWIEFDNGALAGLDYEEAQKKFPRPVFRNPYQRIANGTGESNFQLHSRAMRALENVMQYQRGRYLIVAHGGILNAAIRMALGINPPADRCGVFFNLGFTGYLHLVYESDTHTWFVNELNPGYSK